MAKAMAFILAARVVVVVHSDEPPSHDEWERYCLFCEKLSPDCNRYLVHTEGGGPDAKQRSRAVSGLKGRGHPDAIVAVVTRAPMVRGIVTALGWFNPRIKTFLPLEVDAALRYLKASPAEAGEIAVELRKLQVELKQR